MGGKNYLMNELMTNALLSLTTGPMIPAIPIDRLPREELLDCFKRELKEVERLRSLLCDNAIDPDGEPNERVSYDMPDFNTEDSKEETRLKARRFLKEALFDAVEQAGFGNKLTHEQQQWFNDIDMLLALN